MAINPYMNNPYMMNMNWNPQWNQPQPAAGTVQPQQQTPARSFMTVPSEMDVQNYPIAPGNSVLFQLESNPSTFIEKTMGFSSLDKPTMKRFKLVPDEAQNQQEEKIPEQVGNSMAYATKAEYDELRAAYAKLKDDFDVMRKSIVLFTDKGENNEHE